MPLSRDLLKMETEKCICQIIIFNGEVLSKKYNCIWRHEPECSSGFELNCEECRMNFYKDISVHAFKVVIYIWQIYASVLFKNYIMKITLKSWYKVSKYLHWILYIIIKRRAC